MWICDVITNEVADKFLYPARANNLSVVDLELSVGLPRPVSGELSVLSVGVPSASHLFVRLWKGPLGRYGHKKLG